MNDFSFFRHHRLSDHVYIVRESFGYDGNLPNSYFFIGVVIGSERVGVFDSGNGATPGLRRYIEENITGKREMVCFLSHNHLDHIGGSMLFDKRYLHKDDFDEDEFAWATNLDRHFFSDVSDLAAFCQNDPEVLAYCREHYLKERATPADCIPVEDGDVIDLGGVEVEVFHTPGHSRGSSCYYIRKDHLAFAGDAIPASGLSFSPVLVDGESETYHYLKRVREAWEPDTMIVGGHHMINGMELVDKLIEGYEDILNGRNLQNDIVSPPAPFKYTNPNRKGHFVPGTIGMRHFHQDVNISYRVKLV